mgnify:CR=1 FL=1
MKLHFRSLVSIALSAALLLGCVGCGGAPKAATTITVWTYYSGDQLTSFNELVDEFNSTVGQEKHIVVKSSSQGSVTDLETNVLAAAKGEVGAAALPNIYSGYADMAYDLDQLGEVVDLAPYLTDKEKAAYVDGFLKEGDLMNNGELKVFPVAKSTELFYLNATDWAPFAAATGVTYDDLATVEGVTEAAHKYYDWTDAQTDTPNDGKAFFGRDALANYLLCGAQELGVTIFDAENGVMTLNLDKDVMRKLWDNYYVPFLKGWFGASGRFRSDDMKTGNLLSYVGSSSSSTFFPKQVLTSDTESHDIEMAVLPCPSFSGCAPVAAQQGAGMIVTKGTDAQIEASVEFLKWFTQPENNLQFSVQSGYTPVTYAANDLDAMESAGLEISDSIRSVLTLSISAINNDHLYTTNAFPDDLNEHLTSRVKDASYPLLCNHCTNPPCVRVCPTQATYQMEDGIIAMDYHRCIGCRFCMAGCPFGARSFNFVDPRKYLSDPVPNPAYPTRMIGVVEKCTFCAERLAVGQMPACVEAAGGRILFGDLNDPKSDVCKALASNYSIRRKPNLGTQPGVYYLI